jgi:hypothetical protein
MNLRDAVWTILSNVADNADGLILGRSSAPGDLQGSMEFIRRVRSIMKRLATPKSRLRAPSLARELEALETLCVGSLEQFGPQVQRAIRRAHALAEKNRRVVRNELGADAAS